MLKSIKNINIHFNNKLIYNNNKIYIFFFSLFFILKIYTKYEKKNTL